MSIYNNDRDREDDYDGIDFISNEPMDNESDIDYDDESYDDDNDELSDNEHRTTTTTSHSGKKNHKVTIWSEILSYIKIILVAVVIAFVFTQFIIVNAQVPTGSMQDTIMVGDRLIGFRLSYTFSKPERGDIVIFKYPDDESQNYVKRVIGTPGDIVEIRGGTVLVNGEPLEEDYLRETMISNQENEIYVVPEDSYFMMGDNRNNSLDSRYWNNTYVKKDKILAKVIFRYYSGSSKRLSFGMIK